MRPDAVAFGMQVADKRKHAMLNFLIAESFGTCTECQEMRREGAAGSNAWREDRLAGVTGGTGTLCSRCFEGPLPRGHFLPGAATLAATLTAKTHQQTARSRPPRVAF